MADQITIESVVTGFKFALVETFESVRGMYLDKGTSFFETLEGITAEQASRPISADCATIAAQVAHVTFYLEVMEQAIKAKTWENNADWNHIWQTVSSVSEDEWTASKAKLKATYQRILSAIEQFEQWSGDGQHELSGYLGMIVHSAYHLGEVRQAMCVIRHLPDQGASS